MSSVHFSHTIVISGSDVFANNRSSLMSSRNTCCSHQFSALPSSADMRFRCSTDLLYASTLTSGNANLTAGPYMTVTSSVAPLINAKGSALIANLRSVNMTASMTSHVFLPLNRFILSCSKAILLQEVLDRSMSQISYLFPGIRGSLHIEFPHVLPHLFRVPCQIHQFSQVSVRYRDQR